MNEPISNRLLAAAGLAATEALGLGILGLVWLVSGSWIGIILLAIAGWWGWSSRKLLEIDNPAKRRLNYLQIAALLTAAIGLVVSLISGGGIGVWIVILLWSAAPIFLLSGRPMATLYATGFSQDRPPQALLRSFASRDLGSGAAKGQTLLQVNRLRTFFFTNDGTVKAVDGVNLQVRQGETLGIVGESGCGKSITALSIMRLLAKPGRTVAGEILFDGRDLLSISDEEMESVRGNDISMIFQEPMTALNPVLKVGDQISDSIRCHLGVSDRMARARVVELFEKVRIPEPKQRIQDYPHQLSGGMRQRVMIAMALACNPKLLIADEPTTALDVTIQAQILALLDELKRTEQMGIIMITHDLGVIAEMADYVSVMYAGKIVEEAPVNELFATPQHPYTQGLLTSIPTPDKKGQHLNAIRGVIPHPLNLPPGCSFAPRCPHKFEPCDSAFPALDKTAEKHKVACYLYTRNQDEVRNPASRSL